MGSPYTRSRQEDSYCPECGEHVMLLATTIPDLPAFYICLGGGCGFVGQVGVGPVPEVTEDYDGDEE